MMKKLLAILLSAVMMLGVLMTGVIADDAGLPFSDVKPDDWFYPYVEYVYGEGLMNGTGNGSVFSPNMSLSRAMVVTVLFRNDGAPKTEFKDLFVDVTDPKAYYAEAVVWAKQNGIVTAADVDEWGEELFRPDRDITRQELATMFKRYAEYKYVIASERADISVFPDADKVAASWALDAVQWAVAKGLINGKAYGGTNYLDPTAKASRAEFAAIIQRYNQGKYEYKLVYETPVYGKYTEKDYPLVKDADIYVATDGDDKNDGSFEKPLATFEGAVKKVRELKKTAKDGIVVAFKAGNYGTLTARLTKEDTGTADVPITYCAYGDGDVIFQNGIEVKENEFTPISDAEKSKFLADVADKIYKVDISDRLTADMDLSGSMVFSTETTCTPAQYPNNGALINFTDRYDDRSIIFTMPGIKKTVDSLGDLTGAKVMGYFKYEWLGEEYTIESYDKTTGVITFTDGGSEGIGYEDNENNGECNHVFYMFDFPTALDVKGEYWIDRETGTLYAYEPEGNYMFALEGDMLWLDGGVDYISFIGLNFQGTTETAFYAEASDYITIDQCKFYAIGGEWAVGFSYTKANYSAMNGTTPSSKYVGSSHITFTNNEMSFLAKGAFRAYGANRDRGNAKLQEKYGWGEDFYYLNLVDDGSLIENNLIHDLGWADPFGSGGICVTAFFGLDIRHNVLYNIAREAVGLNGQCRNTNFEYNVISNAMMQSEDGGAFYHGRSHEARGNIIRYNLFCNIPTGAGRYAIYLDDGMTGQEVYGNLFYDAGDVGIIMNGGRDNYIHDNIFMEKTGDRRSFWTNDKYYGAAEAGDDAYLADAAAGFVSSYKSLEKLTEAQKARWMEEYPEMFEIISDHKQYENPMCYVTPKSRYENNYTFNVKEPTGNNKYDLDVPSIKYSTVKNNVQDLSIDTNEFFVDPTHGNYKIKAGAGILDIRFEKIGNY